MESKQKKEKGKVPSEIGSSGVYSKSIHNRYTDAIRELTFPYSLETYDRMAMDVTIASALTAVTTIANRVPIYIEAYDQTTTHINRMKFVEQCFDDMDGETLESVIQKALTFNKYGFSILEKVYRFRRFKNGSKYDDNKIGLKYLPIRRQHSISDFKWDDDYRVFEGVYQNQQPSHANALFGNDRQRLPIKNGAKSGDVFIPKDRFLLFKVDQSTDLPQSVSSLYHAYEGWRELQKYKDLENIAASKNMNGILVGYAPSEYLADDADDDMKRTGKKFKEGLTNLTINEQGCVTLPSERDEASGAREWEVTTLQSSSSHTTTLSSTVTRLQNEILQLLFADTLRAGDEVVVANKNKKSLLNTLVEIRIKEILRVLNTDLIPELFRKNGWSDTKLPKIRYGEIEDIDMATFAKAMQQLRATRMIPMTPQIVNRVLEVMGFTYRVPDNISKEELDKLLGTDEKMQSRSGDGLSTEGEGTSKSPSERDESADNLDNK